VAKVKFRGVFDWFIKFAEERNIKEKDGVKTRNKGVNSV